MPINSFDAFALAKRLGAFCLFITTKIDGSWQDIKVTNSRKLFIYFFINHFALENDIYESINSENPCRISQKSYKFQDSWRIREEIFRCLKSMKNCRKSAAHLKSADPTFIFRRSRRMRKLFRGGIFFRGLSYIHVQYICMYIQSSTYKRGLPELGVSRVAEDYDIVRLRYDRRALCLPLSTILGLSFKNQVIAVVAAARDPAFRFAFPSPSPSPSPSFPFAADNEEKMGDVLSRRDTEISPDTTAHLKFMLFGFIEFRILNKCEVQSLDNWWEIDWQNLWNG